MVRMSRDVMYFVRFLEMLTSETVSSELRRHSNPPRRKIIREHTVMEYPILTQNGFLG